MAASTEIGGEDRVVEMVVHDASESAPDGGRTSFDEITPLITPKFNIFSVSYSHRRPREEAKRLSDTETSSVVAPFILWVWSGSRYSGLLCVALSATIYFSMEVLSSLFTAQSIPLFETAFTRCTIVLVLSYMWMRISGQPIFGPGHARKFLFLRALTGFLSLFSFIYCIQRLPLSQAIVLSFTTPIMASIVARIMLREKLKIADVGGLACSFFGVLFIFKQMLTSQGLNRSGGLRYHIYAVLVGLFSSVTGGISYCLIKAGAKASDQPVATVFSFGILASTAAAICTFSLEDFVLPDIYSLFLLLACGVLAFFAEVFLARGLQLEKTSKAANVIYIEAAMSQVWREHWKCEEGIKFRFYKDIQEIVNT